MKIKAAGKYFSYIAKSFPVMCASGAFPLMPPVTEASRWLDRFDDLSAKAVARHVAKLRKFKNEFRTLHDKAKTREERTATRGLELSVNGVLAELDAIRTWEKAPELYLQIAFTGLEQTVSMPAASEKERQKRFLKRLRAIPDLLALAPQNIESLSSTSRGVAQTMIRDCARYLTELGEGEMGKLAKAPKFLADSLTALREFDRFLTHHPETPEAEGPPFDAMTRDIIGTDKTASEIFAIAEAEYDRRLESLRWLEREVGNGGDWKDSYENYVGPADDGMEAVDLIVRETHRLRGFTYDTALRGVFRDSPLRVVPQPLHLASTLRPIHYDPALDAWENAISRCYVSAQIFTGRGFRDNPMRLARMRREYVFMAARQTYPGRHLLESQRRALVDNPLSQVTNPLFMAGWLAFAENLLEELGYLESPLDRMVHHRRGLCRAALAMIDAGLAVGTIDQDRCLSILKGAGFSTEESLAHVRAIRMKPADRVMPILGLHELTAMREKSGMNLADFCQFLFAEGQLPFELIAERLNQ